MRQLRKMQLGGTTVDDISHPGSRVDKEFNAYAHLMFQ